MSSRSEQKVVHLTTVHPRKDNRILLRECCTLVEAGYGVHLVVADGQGDEDFRGVKIHDAGAKKSRSHRILVMPFVAQAMAARLDPSIVHVHDPELLLVALFLRLRGYKVIYDSHEDLPRSLMSRAWIPRRIRKLISKATEVVEDFIVQFLTAVIAATPKIGDRFKPRSKILQVVCNYPRLDGIKAADYDRRESRTFCYIGAISEDRGIMEMLEATRMCNARLLLAGPFGGPAHEEMLRRQPGWKNVEYLGIVPHSQVWEILQRSCGGMLFLHPVQNYVESLPTKMYEYMAAGLPILASDYAGWPDVIRENGIGLNCDPLDPEAIAALMQQIIDDPAEAAAMGLRGRQVVMEKFRWENEAIKLVDLYDRILLGTDISEGR